jgi:hypothetical protein
LCKRLHFCKVKVINQKHYESDLLSNIIKTGCRYREFAVKRMIAVSEQHDSLARMLIPGKHNKRNAIIACIVSIIAYHAHQINAAQ